MLWTKAETHFMPNTLFTVDLTVLKIIKTDFYAVSFHKSRNSDCVCHCSSIPACYMLPVQQHLKLEFAHWKFQCNIEVNMPTLLTLCVFHVQNMLNTYVFVYVYIVCAVQNFIKFSEIIHHFFQVLDKYNPPDHFLPESYTCFFLLKMPRYSCKVRITLCIWSCMLKGNFFSFIALICCDKLNTACGFT